MLYHIIIIQLICYPIISKIRFLQTQKNRLLKELSLGYPARKSPAEHGWPEPQLSVRLIKSSGLTQYFLKSPRILVKNIADNGIPDHFGEPSRCWNFFEDLPWSQKLFSNGLFQWLFVREHCPSQISTSPTD